MRYRVQLPKRETVDRPPFEETPLGIVVAVLILLVLMFGIPFLLWLVAA